MTKLIIFGIMLVLSGLALTKELDDKEDKSNVIAKKETKLFPKTVKEKRQIFSGDISAESPAGAVITQLQPAVGAVAPAPLPVATSVSVEPNPVILRQEVPRFITRTITRDVPVERQVAVPVRVLVPVDRPVAVPVVHRVPVEVTKHVPVYYEKKVAVPYPVTVERQVAVERPVYVDRPVPHPVLVERRVPVPHPVFLTQPPLSLPQQPLLFSRQVAPALPPLPSFFTNLPNFPDIPFDLNIR